MVVYLTQGLPAIKGWGAIMGCGNIGGNTWILSSCMAGGQGGPGGGDTKEESDWQERLGEGGGGGGTENC